MSAPIARHVIARGRVQGVGFRMACEREAAESGVVGWVRNRADGAVEAHVEGQPAAVRAMVEWLRRGPRHAAVETVDVTDVGPEGLADFTVR